MPYPCIFAYLPWATAHKVTVILTTGVHHRLEAKWYFKNILRSYIIHFFLIWKPRAMKPKKIFSSFKSFCTSAAYSCEPLSFFKKHHNLCTLLSTCSKYIACIYSARLLQQVYESMYIYSIHAACWVGRYPLGSPT